MSPFFYIESFDRAQTEIELPEESSRHIVSVLRMQRGEKLNLTDGKGSRLYCSIIDNHKKHCRVRIETSTSEAPAGRKVAVAISVLKNSSRFEWFLEKVTEIGIQEIMPLICERTEKQKFRSDRMKQILVSAMLQSQQCWLPVLHEPLSFENFFSGDIARLASQKFIAHCIDGEKRDLADLVNDSLPSQIILIGPEGDFTPEEVKLAVDHHFTPVALGETRLRAETAGMVAATILKLL
jgi:16S rRNA (uracil1498-N3)-methyltransferase